MNIEAIFELYQDVMIKELELRTRCGLKTRTDGLPFLMHEVPIEAYAVVWRLMENAKSEFVSRSYNSRYNLYDGNVVFESVAAHTNLMGALISNALDYHYGGVVFGESNGVHQTTDGYTYREIMEAVRLHDLAENETGDIPDNGARNETEKTQHELAYFKTFVDTFGNEWFKPKMKVLRLLEQMQKREGLTGRLMFLSDKLSASIVTLCLDYFIQMPMMHFGSPFASDRDRYEMVRCEYENNGYFRASEMWTMDFLKVRRHFELDETMFFTGILVMATLVVNGKWYSWRDEDYQE